MLCVSLVDTLVWEKISSLSHIGLLPHVNLADSSKELRQRPFVVANGGASESINENSFAGHSGNAIEFSINVSSCNV